MARSLCPPQSDQSPQPRPGAGARLVRRLGGTVRRAIAGGLAHAGVLRRRPAVSQPGIGHDSAARDAAARPAPEPKPRTRRQRDAVPAAAARPADSGWLVPWLGGSRRRRAPLGRNNRPPAPRRPEQLPDTDVTLFTPEAFPVLSPEACAFLNTPLEQCDPDILVFMFSGLTQYLIELPPDADTPDPFEVFATLWSRLTKIRGGAAPATEPNAVPAGEPNAAPAAERDAALAAERDAALAAERDAAPTTQRDAAPTTQRDAAPTTQPGTAPAAAIDALPQPLPEAHTATLPDAARVTRDDASATGPDTRSLPPARPVAMHGAPLIPGPAEARRDTLDAAPFPPQPPDAGRGDTGAPPADRRVIEQSARPGAARALPRSARASWRRHFALPAGAMTFRYSNVVGLPNSHHRPRPRRVCHAARASPV